MSKKQDRYKIPDGSKRSLEECQMDDSEEEGELRDDEEPAKVRKYDKPPIKREPRHEPEKSLFQAAPLLRSHPVSSRKRLTPPPPVILSSYRRDSCPIAHPKRFSPSPVDLSAHQRGHSSTFDVFQVPGTFCEDLASMSSVTPSESMFGKPSAGAVHNDSFDLDSDLVAAGLETIDGLLNLASASEPASHATSNGDFSIKHEPPFVPAVDEPVWTDKLDYSDMDREETSPFFESLSDDEDISPDVTRTGSREDNKDSDLNEEDAEAEGAEISFEEENFDADAMLEEADGIEKKDGDNKPSLISSSVKYFLIERSNQLFEFLPQGWIKVIHQSGMPIYFHRESRICSLSRPYGLGKAGLRNHKIPISAIPCFEYRTAKEEEEEKTAKADVQPVSENQGPSTDANELAKQACTKVMTADAHLQKSLLSTEAVRGYCSKLFDFKCKTVRRYSTWKVGRGRQRMVKKLQDDEPTSESDKFGVKSARRKIKETPETMLKNSKVVTITRMAPDGMTPISFFLNPANKTPVSILHEFVQHTRKLQPLYEFVTTNDANAPYETIIHIDGKEEGRGSGPSKKVAKVNAARKAVMKLAPELRSVIDGTADTDVNDEDIFARIDIEDTRVGEISFKAGIAAPYQILSNALRRVHAQQPEQVTFKMTGKASHLKNRYTMTTGTHTAELVHQLKNVAKQVCAQKILKLMHPELSYYGELLKMYGMEYQRQVEKKRDVQRAITDLQTKGKWGEPNWELLDKLKKEMLLVIPVPQRPGETSRIRYD